MVIINNTKEINFGVIKTFYLSKCLFQKRLPLGTILNELRPNISDTLCLLSSDKIGNLDLCTGLQFTPMASLLVVDHYLKVSQNLTLPMPHTHIYIYMCL